MKVAWITGAARRIGAAIACELHTDYDLVLHYHRSESAAMQLQEQLNAIRPDSTRALRADLSDASQLEHFYQQGVAWRSEADVLINNASAFYDTPFGAIDTESWDELLNSNLRAGFFLTQHLAQVLRSNKGCVINMGDARAEGVILNRAPYAIAKSGVHAMTRTLAGELAPDVRVNALAPGAILWPQSGAEDQQQVLSALAIKRTGSVDEVLATLRFLIEATYITGQVLSVDGGYLGTS